MRTWSRVRRGAALTGAAAVLVAAAPPIPDPVLVEGPVELPAELAIRPAVQEVALTGEGVLVEHLVEQGLDEEVGLALEVREVGAGPDGAPAIGDAAPGGWRLPADRVVVGPGERATVRSAVTSPGVVAVTATPPGDDPLVAFVVVDDGAPRDVTTDARVDGSGAVVTVTSSAPAVAEASLRVTPPLGPALVDDTVGPVVLLADTPRTLTWTLDLPATPWPLTITAEVTASDGTRSVTSARVWAGSGPWLAAALVLLLAAVALLAVVLRRRRGRRP